MIKRFSSCLLIVVLLFALASCGDKFDEKKYIGEGLLTRLGILVDANQTYYNDVFVMGRLEYDEKTTVKKDGKTYALVTDSIYTTYEALETSLKDVYLEDEAERILKEYNYYTDIDGKLYIDLSKTEVPTKGHKWVRDRTEQPELEGSGEDFYIIEFYFRDGKSDELDEFKFVNTKKGYRLTVLQEVD